jgi:hypothetical protein
LCPGCTPILDLVPSAFFLTVASSFNGGAIMLQAFCSFRRIRKNGTRICFIQCVIIRRLISFAVNINFSQLLDSIRHFRRLQICPPSKIWVSQQDQREKKVTLVSSPCALANGDPNDVRDVRVLLFLFVYDTEIVSTKSSSVLWNRKSRRVPSSKRWLKLQQHSW